MKFLVSGLIIMLAAGSARAADLSSLLTGKDVPATLHLRDLDSGWSRVTVAPPGSNASNVGDAFKDIATLGMASGGGGPSSDTMGLMFISSLLGGANAAAAYYTKGQTVNVGSEVFVVAYKYEEPPLNLMQIAAEAEKQGGGEPDVQKMLAGRKMTGDSPLNLSLINVKNIGALTLVRSFDLDKEIAESGNNPLMDMLMLGSKHTTTMEPMPPGPPGPPGAAVPMPPPTPSPSYRPAPAPARNAVYWGNLGWEQYGQGKVQEAIASSRKAASMDPKLAYVRMNLGLYYAVLGNGAQSRKEYAAGIRLASASDIQGAIGDVNAALKKHPKSATLKQALRTLQAAQKR